MTNDSISITFPAIYGERVEHLYPGVSVTIERITPDVAEKMLGMNIKNRDINSKSIVITALQNGEWELNGATIVFDENGILRDGQHRLHACVKTGKPITSVVVRGVKGEAQITMDTGTKRALRDYTKMMGYPDYSTVATIGLALYLVDVYGIEAYVSSHRGGKATYKAVIDFIERAYPSRIEPIVGDTRSVMNKYKHINSGIMSVAFDAFRAVSNEDYQEFMEQILNRHPACVSVRLLQNAFEKQSAEPIRAKRLPDKYVLAYTIKAWNAYMRGDDVKQLKFRQGGANPEAFPEVLGGFE